jgi:hypothetical protein
MAVRRCLPMHTFREIVSIMRKAFRAAADFPSEPMSLRNASVDQSFVTGQPVWTMPTVLDVGAAGAERCAEQWAELIDGSPRRRRFEPDVADMLRAAIVVESRPAVSAPEDDRPEPSPCVEITGDASSSVAEAQASALAAVSSATGPVSATLPAPPLPQYCPELLCILEKLPPGHSIAPYLHRMESIQLALVIARLEHARGQARLRRSRRHLRRALGALALGASVCAFVLGVLSGSRAGADSGATPPAVTPAATRDAPAALTMWTVRATQMDGGSVVRVERPATVVAAPPDVASRAGR